MLSEPFDEIASCVDVNLTGIMRVTLAFAPLLGADLKRTGAPGRILHFRTRGGAFCRRLLRNQGAFQLKR